MLLFWLQLLMLYSYGVVKALYTMRQLFKYKDRDIDIPENSLSTRLQHIVMMCTYKEPVELLERTMDSLKKQTQREKTIMVVAMEERTPDKEEKEKSDP